MPRYARVVGLAVTGVLMTACGGAPEHEAHESHEARTALRTARQQVASAGSARVDATMTTGKRLTSRSTGALDWSDGVEGTLTLRVTGGELASSMRELGGDPSQTRYLPDAYYTRMSARFAELQGGRRWIRHAYDTRSDLTPADALKSLAGAKDVHRVGRETVRGTRTTHYRGTSGRQHIDVWLDARQLLVRRTQRAGDFTGTVHYRDYGAPARAQRPADRDTVDFADVTGAG
ncbi:MULTISPECIES: hypothetical protein [unclassified Streptomyces]|uniref:hypothetical protein n=1 Tax=unclassified Streptomyces TaxID=2593676 RepID=UPI00278C7678|nr:MULTISPECIES: hypothetical protein [unclassified Streptomyces]